jgi:tRNA dimethylallyltransferase
VVPAPLTDTTRSLVVICGPTAVGKTAAAVELASQLGGEIVCADSRTLYRGMDIGTAKPTAEQRRRVPHHLIDVADPDQPLTVATYRVLALQAVEAIRRRGRVPLLVGGTGLYIRAVVDGWTIPAVPPDPALRARLEEEERARPGSLHARLRQVDPVAAARTHPHNVRRLVRALEVYAHTGRPISELQRADPIGAAVQVGLTMDRAALYRRIEARVRDQLECGLVEEVRTLLARGYDPRLPAMQGLGYKEIAAFLRGECSLEEAVARLVRNTRHYARRQWIWFRRDPRIRWLDVDDLAPAQVADAIAAMLQ